MTSGSGAVPARTVLSGMRRSLWFAMLLPPGLLAAAAALAYLVLPAQGVDGTAWIPVVHVLWGALVALVLAAVLAGLLAARLASRIGHPVQRVGATLQALRDGDLDARTGLRGDDDVLALGEALDALVEERVSALDRVAKDNEELNDSVIEIMQAVGTIASTKDLTIRVPVNENVTGAIADALNLLTDETRRVLLNVRGVSDDVAQATVAVKSQGEIAARAAAREQQEVENAARELSAAAAALGAIADRARACDDAAERAVEASAEAMRTVSSTARGVEQSRTLIRETEKRIKRLGERSQEIGQVVGIIHGIAERTGILALNASLQAAAAGDAGRHFAVVGDEVRRLSESARDASGQIQRLVSAIQAETGDTVRAMNQAISQVVEISRLAEDAGAGMRRTHDDNEALAADVRDIARTSSEQARVGAALFERARIIQEASGETERQLSLQAKETARLVECARALLEEVDVFRLMDR